MYIHRLQYLSRTAPLHHRLAHLSPTGAVRQPPWTQAGSMQGFSGSSGVLSNVFGHSDILY